MGCVNKMMKNKKASTSIAIVILVIAVIVLCTVVLTSFYLIRGNQVKGVVNSAYSLQNFYNMADSVEYSGEELHSSYDEVTISDGEINKKFFDGDLEITYKFKP